MEDSVTGTSAVPYTVPNGFVAVIRCFSVLCVGSGATATILRSGGVAIIWRATSTAANQLFVQEGRWVLNQGESLEVAGTGTSACQFNINGYVLEGP